MERGNVPDLVGCLESRYFEKYWGSTTTAEEVLKAAWGRVEAPTAPGECWHMDRGPGRVFIVMGFGEGRVIACPCAMAALNGKPPDLSKEK